MNDSLLAMLKRIYDSEINVKITSDWDAGFTIRTGDEYNGFTPESCGLNAEQIEEALREEVLEHYPISDFAKAEKAKADAVQMTGEHKAFCCHRNPETDEDCGVDAEWNVHFDGTAPEMVTQMCSKHLAYSCNLEGWTRVWPVES